MECLNILIFLYIDVYKICDFWKINTRLVQFNLIWSIRSSSIISIQFCDTPFESHQHNLSVYFGPVWSFRSNSTTLILSHIDIIFGSTTVHSIYLGPIWSIQSFQSNLIHFRIVWEERYLLKEPLTKMSHFLRKIGRFLIKLHLSYVIKILNFFFFFII